MQFIYCSDAGNSSLTISDDIYKYLFKARREKVGAKVTFRNLIDSNIYYYEVSSISKRDALLNLISHEELIVESNKKLHIIWCVVDSKTIEKQLPYLNEIGVDKISFVYCDYSQKSFKLNFEKYEKILFNSSQQCGRSSIIKLDIIDSLDKVLESHKDCYMFNFSQNHIDTNKDIKTIIIGCEGGFSKKEIAKFDSEKIVGIDSNLILRSETAITVVASKLLL